MGAVSLSSAAGVGDGSASSGDLRVSLFSWISSKNLSRKGRSIKEKVMLAVNWRRRPSFPSLNMYTGMQNFPSFSFLCYSLLVDLYLLIVPKLRSAFLDLQFCRPWASNFCCNLSYFFFFFIRFVKDGGIGYGHHLRPVNFFPFFVSEKNEKLIKKKKIRGNLRPLRSGFHWRRQWLSPHPLKTRNPR